MKQTKSQRLFNNAYQDALRAVKHHRSSAGAPSTTSAGTRSASCA